MSFLFLVIARVAIRRALPGFFFKTKCEIEEQRSQVSFLSDQLG